MAVTLEKAAAGRRRSLFPMLGLAAAAALGIFLLPWFVPFRQPVNSLSYSYGFNNTAAWIAVAALIGLIFLMRVAGSNAIGADALESRLSSIIADRQVRLLDARLLGASLAVTTIGLAAEILLYAVLPTNDFGEISQHTVRLDWMLFGQRPHLDFQYNFGPGMLYAAYGLYRLGAGAVSIDTAYCLTLCAEWTAGCFLLYYVVHNLGDGVRKATVYLCVSALFLSPALMAPQYTMVRYILPMAAVIFVHRSVLKLNMGLAATSAILLPLAALAFSPDAGIATTAALAVCFAALVLTSHRKFSFCALVCLGAAAVGVYAFGADYLHSIRQYSASVSAFPVFPSLTIVLFLGAVFLVVPSLLMLGFRQRTPTGSLALGMAVVLGLAIPPALGRADLMHVSWNGAPVLIIALALLTTWKNTRVYRATLCTYIVFFPLCTLTATMWHSYGGAIFRFVETTVIQVRGRADSFSPATVPVSSNHESPMEQTPRPRFSKPARFSPDLEALLRYPKIGLPFGANEDIRRFLKISRRFVPGYWPEAFSYLGTEVDISRKVHDLASMNVILVPTEVFLVDNYLTVPVASDLSFPAQIDPAVHRRNAEHILRPLTFFPVWLPLARNVPVFPEIQILEEIAKNYRSAGQFRTYIIAVKH